MIQFPESKKLQQTYVLSNIHIQIHATLILCTNQLVPSIFSLVTMAEAFGVIRIASVEWFGVEIGQRTHEYGETKTRRVRSAIGRAK